MAPNALSGSLRRRRTSDADQQSPTTLNTRKQQRLNYQELHNIGISTTPTSTNTSPRPSPRRSPRQLAPIARMQPLPRPRAQPLNPLRQRPLFVPTSRQPILQPSMNVIEVIDPSNASQKVSRIAKHKWWWNYYTVRLLDTMFHKGRQGDGDVI